MQWHAGLAAVRLAAGLVPATVAGRLVALTALCAAVSLLEVGVGYREKAFAGAAPAGFGPRLTDA